jgi:hypothetical protein
MSAFLAAAATSPGWGEASMARTFARRSRSSGVMRSPREKFYSSVQRCLSSPSPSIFPKFFDVSKTTRLRSATDCGTHSRAMAMPELSEDETRTLHRLRPPMSWRCGRYGWLSKSSIRNRSLSRSGKKGRLHPKRLPPSPEETKPKVAGAKERDGHARMVRKDQLVNL